MVSAIRYTACLMIILLSAVLPSHAQATSRILIFGDSLTAGYRLQPHEALPEVVERKLHAQQKDVDVINGGVSGDTTSGGVRRLKWMLDRHSPGIVLLALGGNDMLRGIAPAVVRENLDTMLAQLQQRNIKTILMAVKTPPNHDPAYAASFNAIYPDLAKKYNVALYPFFLEALYGQREYMLDDGIHPNARGIDYIADYLVDYFVRTGWI